MRRTGIMLVILAIVAIAYYFLILTPENQDSSSITVEDRAFIVENPDNISIITIKSTGYPLIHLNKQGEYWYINQNHRADPTIIRNMLTVLSKMRINYIPPRTQHDMIFRSVGAAGIKIKSYDSNGNILSDFVMASNTNKEDGTYCIKAGSNQPYVMSMPIVEGGLRNYFTHDINGLRDKTIIELDTRKIQKIDIRYPKDQDNNFTLQKATGGFVISGTSLKFAEAEYEKNRISAFIKDFDVLNAEYVSNENPARDSIENKLPLADIRISLNNDLEYRLEFYPDLDIYDPGINTRSVENLGKVERYFVATSWGDTFIAQHRLVSKWLRTPQYFLKR